ncbi:MAG: hypothetical protein F6K28_38605 [Microcoleus sp. SIO2G3]|nr:hypothetical protein [Microcoleus sp. SIO2G3]
MLYPLSYWSKDWQMMHFALGEFCNLAGQNNQQQFTLSYQDNRYDVDFNRRLDVSAIAPYRLN